MSDFTKEELERLLLESDAGRIKAKQSHGKLMMENSELRRENAHLRQQLADYQSADEANAIEALKQAAESLAVKALEKRLAEARATIEELERVSRTQSHSWRYLYQMACWQSEQKLSALLERLGAAEKMLIEVYRHVGNSSPKRHALPPGLRDSIRDYTKANCPERAGWLPPASTNNEPPKGQ